MALDGLYVPQNASWLSDFRSELLSFPAGNHDDIVDALGLIGQLLDYMAEGRRTATILLWSRWRPDERHCVGLLYFLEMPKAVLIKVFCYQTSC